MLDVMGYDDDASRGVVAEGFRAAQAEGRRPLTEPDRKEAEANWAAMKRRLGSFRRL
jgi:hypothetical protein